MTSVLILDPMRRNCGAPTYGHAITRRARLHVMLLGASIATMVSVGVRSTIPAEKTAENLTLDPAGSPYATENHCDWGESR